MSGKLLSIDVGGTSAFFVGAAGCDAPAWGHRPLMGEDVTEPEIFWRFSCWLNELVAEHSPIAFAIEKAWVRHGAKFDMKAASRIIGMTSIALGIAYSHKLRIYEWEIDRVAKHFGAAGMKSDAKKKHIQKTIRDHYGWNILNINSSDAAAVWIYTEAKVVPNVARMRGVGDLFTAKVMRPRKAKVVTPDLLTVSG